MKEYAAKFLSWPSFIRTKMMRLLNSPSVSNSRMVCVLRLSEQLGLVMSSMNGEMVVETPAKGSVTTSLVCLKCPLSIFGRDFSVDDDSPSFHIFIVFLVKFLFYFISLVSNLESI